MTRPTPVVPGPVSEFLSGVALAPRQAAKALTLWPLVQPEGESRGPKPFVTLADALARDTVRVDEVGEGGQVPLVRVTNSGDVAVLFLFGEEILGALQNRVANASFLVPARSQVEIDVSCVEAGRWSRRSRRFGASREVLSSALRRKMAGRVAQSRAASGGTGRFQADQGEVWAEIGDRLAFSAAPSSTSAYADYRASRSTDLDEVGRAFRPVERQVGFVAAIGDEVVGLEAIGRPEPFEKSFRALLRSYAIDAIDAALVKQLDAAPGRQGRRFDAPEPFLEALARTPCASGPSLGAGDDLRLDGAEVAGCALAEGGLVQLTAFTVRG
jgi:hypothetical protein